jgi:hypothetical protein
MDIRAKHEYILHGRFQGCQACGERLQKLHTIPGQILEVSFRIDPNNIHLVPQDERVLSADRICPWKA